MPAPMRSPSPLTLSRPPARSPPTHPPSLHADLALFAVIADVSILTLNLSLMLNTVSFYQVSAVCVVSTR